MKPYGAHPVGQLTNSAAAELSELVGERAMPHHRELAVRACQRCVQLSLPPDVLGEGSRLHHHDRVELKSTCLLGVIEANLKSILRPDERLLVLTSASQACRVPA